MKKNRVNYHNHTVFSDGGFLPEVIVEEALKRRMAAVGISDHCFSGGKLGPNDRGAVEKYISALESVRSRYEGKIRVAIGMEVIFGPNMADKGIPRDICSRLDYILFEYVGLYSGFGLDELVSIRDKFECRVGLAHTDVDVAFPSLDYSSLIDILEHADIFVELCPSPRNMRVTVEDEAKGTVRVAPPYRCSRDFFSKLRDRKVGLTIGTDTHDDLSDVSKIDDALNFVGELNLWNNLLYL